MLSDAELISLNRLVDDQLSAGRTSAQALKALEAALRDRVIPGDELVFRDGCSERALPAHILLCNDGSGMSRSLGQTMNGIYSDRSLHRAADACALIEGEDRAQEPIADQILLCLRILALESVHPETASEVRRHLSSILLRYPVLLHPAFLVPTRPAAEAETEYRCIAHILAGTAHGGLPRFSHFSHDGHHQRAGSEVDLAIRIDAFAKHPCVQRALNATAGAVVLVGGRIRRQRHNLAHAFARRMGSRVQFIASVMELDDRAHPGTPSPRFGLLDQCTDNGPVHDRARAILLDSFADACGLVYLGDAIPIYASLPFEMRRRPLDHDFLHGFARRLPSLTDTKAPESPDKPGTSLLSAVAPRRIFVDRFNAVSPADLAHNVRGLVSGMAHVGAFPSMASAAAAVFEVSVPTNDEYPRYQPVAVCGAMSVLKELADLGGLGATDEAIIQSLLDLKLRAEAASTPDSSQWALAASFLATERSMQLTITRHEPSPATQSPANRQGAVSAPAPPRRPRASL